MGNKVSGNLIIIGGAEDKQGDKVILKHVCSKLEGKDDSLVVATIASQVPHELEIQYKKVFGEMGVKNINILNVKERSDSEEQSNIEMIEKASVIFFTGGDQLRITSFIGGTKLYNSIKNRYVNGCTLVGTSAGASVMSDTMIVSGPDEESPRKCTLKMAPGLGLIKGVIIDQHFAQRGRIGRLLVGIAENPQSIGIGIDEDTAIIVNEAGDLKVIGSGAVYVIDGSRITNTNVSEEHPDDILSIYNVLLHVLKSGDKFSLNYREPIL